MWPGVGGRERVSGFLGGDCRLERKGLWLVSVGKEKETKWPAREQRQAMLGRRSVTALGQNEMAVLGRRSVTASGLGGEGRV